MNKSAKVKFANAINSAANDTYLQTFLEKCAERGVQCNSDDDLSLLLKTASALRAVSTAVAPAIKEANTAFLTTACDDLLHVEL